MAEHLIPIHSSLDLTVATRITDEVLRLRQLHKLLPLAVPSSGSVAETPCVAKTRGQAINNVR